MSSSHDDSSEPATANGPGRTPGGLPLTIRLAETDYASLLRIASHRSTTAAHLVEDLVRHALSRATIPPATEVLSGQKLLRVRRLIAEGLADEQIAEQTRTRTETITDFRAHDAPPTDASHPTTRYN